MKRCQRYPCLFVFGLVISAFFGEVFGQTGFVSYAPPRDYVEQGAKTAALVLTMLAALLILYTLARYRQRLFEYHCRWMLFLGLCILPLPIMLMSTGVGLEQAKDVEFCNSCHVMGPFVEDMEDPQSNRLAAVHFKNRYIQEDHCYVCHTNYGLFGTVEAKVGGLSHIWQDTTGSYRLPVKVRDHYRFTICLNCHGQSQKFQSEASHHGSVEDVLSGQGGCTDCHELSHPPRENRS
ncbi:MAG: NapC/NirT family cytochrome c [Acidobacteriota bacterium]|nr:MAG: NapC/NirT family cytochrome c [Acidobacteriota bacterium]